MRTVIVISIWIASAGFSWAQNCVVSGGTNYGTITQNCIIARDKLTFQTAIGEELVSKIPAGKPVRLLGVGSQNDQAVVSEYQQFLQKNGFQVERGMMGGLFPPPDHPIMITITPETTIITITPRAY